MGAVIVLTGFGFFSFSSGSDEIANKSFFDVAYRWLNRNTPRDSVVLTASPKMGELFDYLPLYTHQKIYRGLHGIYLDRVALNYKDMFMAALYLGILDEISISGVRTMDEKLRRYRLDYILIDRKSPFFSNVEKVMRGHLQEVYRDNTCLIWKVLTSG